MHFVFNIRMNTKAILPRAGQKRRTKAKHAIKRLGSQDRIFH